MIPKKIHYCWYGGKAKPEIVRKCIDSWKRFNPDYQIKEWNESNSPKHSIITSNLNKGIWAFASDYTRLFAIYEEGGFYLDTDILLVKGLDNLRNNTCILAFESIKWVNNGFCAAIPKHYFFKMCMKELSSKGHSRIKPYTSPHLTTNMLKKIKPTFVYKTQHFRDILVLNLEFFFPYNRFQTKDMKIDQLIGMLNSTSYGIHLFLHSWKDSSQNYNTVEKLILLTKKVKFKLNKIIRTI